MVFILEAGVVLDLSVAADSFFGQGADTTLVVLHTSVHDDVGLIRDAVNSILTE